MVVSHSLSKRQSIILPSGGLTLHSFKSSCSGVKSSKYLCDWRSAIWIWYRAFLSLSQITCSLKEQQLNSGNDHWNLCIINSNETNWSLNERNTVHLQFGITSSSIWDIRASDRSENKPSSPLCHYMCSHCFDSIGALMMSHFYPEWLRDGRF